MDNLDWNLLRAFAFTAETGSVSAAARRLGLTQPTVSRQVAALEASLGVALFERVGKRLIPTETGLGLLEHARTMAKTADTLALAAAGRATDSGGRVVISASDAMAAYLLPDIVARIRRETPQITVVVVASNALSDLRRREADIAIRHVRPAEPDLIGQLIRETTAHFYAAEGWISRHRAPRTLSEIGTIDLIGFEPIEQSVAYLRNGGIMVTSDQFRIVSESGVTLWEMVRRGLGLGMMLREIAAVTPGVVELFPEWPGVAVPVWLVSHRELRTSRRVRVVYEILVEELKRNRPGSRKQSAA